MVRRSSKLLMAFLSVVTVAAATGTVVYLLQSQRMNVYLFVEKRVEIEAQVIQGKWGLFIDFPTYMYNASRRELQPLGCCFDVNSTLLAVYGSYSLLVVKGSAGGGISSHLEPIYSLPYESGDYFGLEQVATQIRIELDGTVHVTFAGEIFTLRPGEMWHGSKEYVKQYNDAIVKFKQTTEVENFGYWNKAEITFLSPPAPAAIQLSWIPWFERSRAVNLGTKLIHAN